MGLESASYVAQLNSSNPASTDSKAQGDDHLRLLKAVLQTTFPNANKPFYLPTSSTAVGSNYAVASPSDAGKTIPVPGGLTVSLPASPAFDGFEVTIIKADHSSGVVRVDASGNDINGDTYFYLIQRYQKATFTWCAAVSAWFATTPQVVPIASLLAIMGVMPDGYVLANAKTIGKAGSGATAVASKIAQGLFEVLWDNVADTYCPVSGGRGASAVADFNSNKTLTLPDLRGRVPAGLDGMGNSAANLLTSVLTLGSVQGASSHTLDTTQLPSHGHGVTDPGHFHNYETYGLFTTTSGGSTGTVHASSATGNTTNKTTGITVQNTGGGLAHNNVQPSYGVNWALKL